MALYMGVIRSLPGGTVHNTYFVQLDFQTDATFYSSPGPRISRGGTTSIQYLCNARRQRIHESLDSIVPQQLTHPSGSKMNAMSFILPSVNFFLKVTPSFSNLSHAALTFGTVMAMWPKPFPGSVFPEAYPPNDASDSDPWLCVSSRTPGHRFLLRERDQEETRRTFAVKTRVFLLLGR